MSNHFPLFSSVINDICLWSPSTHNWVPHIFQDVRYDSIKLIETQIPKWSMIIRVVQKLLLFFVILNKLDVCNTSVIVFNKSYWGILCSILNICLYNMFKFKIFTKLIQIFHVLISRIRCCYSYSDWARNESISNQAGSILEVAKSSWDGICCF